MLVELAETLESSGVSFALARDVGQVGDVIEREGGETTIQIYKSVAAAVQALSSAPARRGPQP